MTLPAGYAFDPEFDLMLEREVDLPPHLVWAAWTDPKHIVQWFTPAPWKTPVAETDLRPGGRFHTVMRGPEGQEVSNNGCYLEVIENQRLVWTTTMTQGFRPQAAAAPFHFTAMILIEPKGTGSLYKAIVVHSTADGCKQHADMGFHDGWGKALDQLVAHMKTAG
jgi:uncharacterized protein YndB with AHSA1/START domain